MQSSRAAGREGMDRHYSRGGFRKRVKKFGASLQLPAEREAFLANVWDGFGEGIEKIQWQIQ